MIFSGTGLPWSTIWAITCGVTYTPLLASVANVVACSSTVSEAMPSAMPTSPTLACRLDAFVSTPNALAMLTVARVPARCTRSSNPGSDDTAAAFGTLSLPMFSPPMLTGKKVGGQLVVRNDSSARVCADVSGGTHIGSIPLRMLFDTFMPSDTAVDSTYGLNEDPTCSLFSVAMLSWQKILAHNLGLVALSP